MSINLGLSETSTFVSSRFFPASNLSFYSKDWRKNFIFQVTRNEKHGRREGMSNSGSSIPVATVVTSISREVHVVGVPGVRSGSVSNSVVIKLPNAS